MEAAWPVKDEERTEQRGVPRPPLEMLERIARLACREVGAREVAVLVRDERDPRRLMPLAHSSGAPAGATPRMPRGPALDRALKTGAPAAGDAGHVVCAAAPIVRGGTVRGALAASGGDPARRCRRADLDALGELAELAALTLEEAERRARLEEIVDVGVAALVRAVDMRDGSTGRHSESVGALARRVGERLGMGGSQLWLLELGARLHDVGKIGVPDAVLNKPGPLAPSEWELMRRHAELGAEMVAKVPGLEPVAPLVRAHHERWDGHGYPDGLRRGAIPLASRVIAACDAFQAMTAERPYRAALEVETALAELSAGAGTQFDPAVVAALRHESGGTAAVALPSRVPR
jgi:HD domain/GAF domain